MWNLIHAWMQRRIDRRMLRARLAQLQQQREAYEQAEAKRVIEARLFRIMRSAA